MDALTSTYGDIAKRFHRVTKLVKAQVEESNFRKNSRPGFSSIADSDRSDSRVSDDLEDQRQQQILKQKQIEDQIKIENEVDFHERVINDRADQINKIENLFVEIHGLAQDINKET